MSKNYIPYFDFYPSDFMNGVRGMSAQEVGVYTMLLCRIYEENGPVEMHHLRLATYCGMREKTFVRCLEKLIALGKIVVENDRLTNKRAEGEIQYRSDKLKNNSKAGKASAKKRKENKATLPTPVEHAFNHTDTDSTLEDKSSKGADAPKDPAKIMFDSGVILLADAGMSDKQARAILGKWRSQHGEANVIAAIGKAQREGAIDPVAFIAGVLRFSTKQQDRPGLVSAGAFGSIPERC